MKAGLVAAAALFSIAATGCADDESDATDDGTEVAAEPSGESEEDTTDSDDDPASAAETEENSEEETPEPADEIAELAAGPLPAGNYQSDLLGTPVSVMLDDELIGAVVEPGMILLDDPGRTTETSEGMLLFRPPALADASEATAGPGDDGLSGDPSDVGAWAEAAGEITVIDQAEAMLGDATAMVTTFELDPEGTSGLPGGCGPTDDDRCFMFAETSSLSIRFIIARTTEIYRTWVIDQGELPPIMILAVANETNAGWLDDRATPLVESMTFGTPSELPEVEVNLDGVLTQQFAPIEPGPWRVESLGTPFEVEIVGEWWTQPNGNGWSVFTDPDSEGPGDQDVVFIRPTTLGLPDDPTVDVPDGEGWPVDDIAGWLESVDDGIVVSGPEPTAAGGLDGIMFEVELSGEELCGDAVCIAFVLNRTTSGIQFEPGFRYRVLWFEQGEFEPLAIVIGARLDDLDWFDQAEEFLGRVEFGEPAPHPVPGG